MTLKYKGIFKNTLFNKLLQDGEREKKRERKHMAQ
jgi:hypothetical protein